MAKHAKFEPIPHGKRWKLNVPACFAESGKRERHFYPTKEKALAAAKALRSKRDDFGKQAQAIKPSLAEEATIAAEILAPWKISIVEAARMVHEIRTRETASTTLSSAIAQWIDHCEGKGLRDRTVRNYKLTLDKISAALGDKLMATITAEELQDAIAPKGTTGAAAAERVRNAKAFWLWCTKKKWCPAETFREIEMPSAGNRDAEISILNPEQARDLLTQAEKHFPQAVASIALQLFAGIRAEEITRLEAQHVSAEGIELPAQVTKKGRRRHITPSETLSAWLRKYPFQPCANWRETFAAVRRLSGWKVSSVILNERIKAGTMAKLPLAHRGAWPQNVLRHSHASYAVEIGTPIEKLLFEFGHAGNTDLLKQHYVGRASRKAAIEYFTIVPEGEAAPQQITLARKGGAA